MTKPRPLGGDSLPLHPKHLNGLANKHDPVHRRSSLDSGGRAGLRYRVNKNPAARREREENLEVGRVLQFLPFLCEDLGDFIYLTGINF
jgi:hypothetical protein